MRAASLPCFCNDRGGAKRGIRGVGATGGDMYRFLRYVPKNHLSRTMGRLVHAPWPRPIARRLVRLFARSYRIDVDAAGKPLHDYPSVGHFFIRDLREGLRPIESDFVSPVDGTLRQFGVITDGRLEQIKGKNYSVSSFLRDEELARRYEGGAYFNLYLSPQDYHHVHSPVGGGISRSVHIPGKLWPVNDWSLLNVDALFSINERVVTYIESSLGLVAVVMIGATNVGKISVVYDSFISNTRGTSKSVARAYETPIPIAAGDRLGTFHMGSSVVVLVEPGKLDLQRVRLERGKKVQYGAAVLHHN
jgi:phosphatidylserine decarboxylase